MPKNFFLVAALVLLVVTGCASPTPTSVPTLEVDDPTPTTEVVNPTATEEAEEPAGRKVFIGDGGYLRVGGEMLYVEQGGDFTISGTSGCTFSSLDDRGSVRITCNNDTVDAWRVEGGYEVEDTQS